MIYRNMHIKQLNNVKIEFEKIAELIFWSNNDLHNVRALGQNKIKRSNC